MCTRARTQTTAPKREMAETVPNSVVLFVGTCGGTTAKTNRGNTLANNRNSACSRQGVHDIRHHATSRKDTLVPQTSARQFFLLCAGFVSFLFHAKSGSKNEVVAQRNRATNQPPRWSRTRAAASACTLWARRTRARRRSSGRSSGTSGTSRSRRPRPPLSRTRRRLCGPGRRRRARAACATLLARRTLQVWCSST